MFATDCLCVSVKDMSKQLLTVPDAAKRLGIARGTLDRRLLRGDIEADFHTKRKGGNMHLFLPATIESHRISGEVE